MKGLEKLTTIRLAEILTQKDAVSTEVLTDALVGQDRYGDSFAETLIQGGHMSEWDLAKLVVEHFQLPFIAASNYDVDDAVKKLVPEDQLFRSLIVPLDHFDNVLTIAMPILTPADVLAKLRKATGSEIFPYIGLVSENRRVLGELFSNFKEFQEKLVKEREAVQAKRDASSKGEGEQGDDWMSIFDSGDEQVRSSLTDS